MSSTLRILGLAIACFAWQIEAAPARSLEMIRATGALHLCAHPNSLPYASKAGNPPGFQIELGKAIAEELGVSLVTEWIDTAIDTAIDRLRAEATVVTIYAKYASHCCRHASVKEGSRPVLVRRGCLAIATGLRIRFAPVRASPADVIGRGWHIFCSS